MAFAPKNDRLLVTLSDEPEQKVFLWSVDKARCLSHQDMSHPTGYAIGTQVSFSNMDSNNILVTGNNTYKFFTTKDNNLQLHSKTFSKKECAHLSTNYTAHCWLHEGKILIGTDQGQLILCQPNGDY